MPTHRIAAALVIIGFLVSPSTGLPAQLSGTYTIDPTGTGPRNYASFAAAGKALTAGVAGPVVFQVAGTTFNESVGFGSIGGASATNPVTFVAPGAPAVLNAGGQAYGIVLAGNASHFVFQNLVVRDFAMFGLDLRGQQTHPRYSSPVVNNTFIDVVVDGPATTLATVRAVNLYLASSNMFRRCRLRGGGQVVCCEQSGANVFDACELDGRGTAGILIHGLGPNNGGDIWQNCFLHDTGPASIAVATAGQSLFWHNTVLVNTSSDACLLRNGTIWSFAPCWRNNLVVNRGTGSAMHVEYDPFQNRIHAVELDYNCYHAPNSKQGTIRVGAIFGGTLSQWKAYLSRLPGIIPPGGGTAYDRNSIEADPRLASAVFPYDIHLTRPSPCRHAGTSRYVPGPWINFNPNYRVLTDFENDARAASGVDIGADEGAAYLIPSGTGKRGSTVTFALSAAMDAGLPYVVGTSGGVGPIPIDARAIPLSPDGLLMASVGGHFPQVFRDYVGRLDSAGVATARFTIPNHAAVYGVPFNTAFLTLDPSAPSGVSNISNAFLFQAW